LSGEATTGVGWRLRLDRRLVVIGLVGVGAALIVGTVDLLLTRGALQEPEPGNFVERLDSIHSLRSGYHSREWVYAIGLSAGLVWTAWAFAQRAEPYLRDRPFASLGCVALVWLVVGAGVVGASSDDLIRPDFAPVGVTAGVMLALSSAGVFAYRRPRLALDRAALVAAGVLVGAGALFFIGDTETCDYDPGNPAPVNVLATLEVTAAGLGALISLRALAERRWIIAPLLLPLALAGALFAVFETVCWN
jgi:hypothetical protein